MGLCGRRGGAEALKVIKSGKPKLLHYGVTQDQAISVGLACGGTIEVWVEKLSRENFERMQQDLQADQLSVAVTVLTGRSGWRANLCLSG